ncbi:acyl-phosphate glycerol-3-phosphate acyltransferase [Aliiroseovarius halocynthiae]|uniref:Glycerol-3-phosphate acyltransferase n=1 Tax=Aliiroseovarius halocynthiae TaxID=985055 RepID=A0A545SZV4_9RHOB|nr:glycerol-3-phosphate 1-O-acyltransferase PlsY [Aliiroseovarius halocynthiae]TQV70461.1 glycerol-3-phosphate 1-O-acyltransferase PlsY [Aliiroseovarius halocynthiae]SMR81818.1 acyl-phosphate glycerol-3-phosphate acyltransferase [Aliiroseovarius halocynthiae]
MPELVTSFPLLLLVAVAGYLLGSIPFGIVMARLFGLGDLRQIGSGNIGATNVLRTGNKLAAFLTVIGDAGKGGAAVLLARALFAEDAAQLAGFAAFLGHCFPIFLGFKGGKGVATWLGTMLALAFPLGLVACATWLVTALIFRMSSLAALVAAAVSPVMALIMGWNSLILISIALAALIFHRHRANIARIKSGEEPRIGRKQSQD